METTAITQYTVVEVFEPSMAGMGFWMPQLVMERNTTNKVSTALYLQ